MSDFSGEQVAEATLDDDYTKPRGWRHNRDMDVSSHADRLGGSAGRIVRAFRRDTEIGAQSRSEAQL